MIKFPVVPFAKHHVRDTFSCGKPALDDFIRLRVSQYEKRRLGKTYVATPDNNHQVVGYYTIAANSVAFESVPATQMTQMPKHPVPVVLLARLAVDQSVQGQGLGEYLLLDALHRSLSISAQLGIHAVIVDAIDDSAICFYLRYGFVQFEHAKDRLILPLATLAQVSKS